MSIKLGPERILHFHTLDPADLGLTLTHTPTTLAMGISTGYVRITSLSSDGGMVEGDARLNDVVVEAAGVNMRMPISEGMWRLTLGLMEVAPRPLEVVVAAEVDEHAPSEREGRDELSNQMTGIEDEKQVGYYQLVTPNKYSVVNDPVLSAKLYHLEDSCDFTHGSPVEVVISPGGAKTPDSSMDQSPVVVRNPFLDPNRFGPERTIVFRTESLGVKLHRSASEGIVHVLHVTSYEPPKGSTMLPPRDGSLEEGDAIMEVGGVDLRNQCIGRIEWADMVHFIKYVGRPLEMVVAKDSMYTRERVGIVAMTPLKGDGASDMDEEKCSCPVTEENLDILQDKNEDGNLETQVLNAENDNQDVVNPVEREQSQTPVENNNNETKAANDEENRTSKASETIFNEALQHVSENFQSEVIDNACNAVEGGACSTPGVFVVAKTEMDENCATPGADAATASGEDSCEKKNTSNVQNVISSHILDGHSWIKSSEEQSEVVDVKPSKASPPRTPKSIFHRTHPTAENTSINEWSPEPTGTTNNRVNLDERETKRKISVSPEAKRTTEECIVISPERKSVAELRGLFSPIKLPDEVKRRPIVSSVEKYEITNSTQTIEVNPVKDSYSDGSAEPDTASHRVDDSNACVDKNHSLDEEHDGDSRAEKSDKLTSTLNNDSPSSDEKNCALCSRMTTDADVTVGFLIPSSDDNLTKALQSEGNNNTNASTDILPFLPADLETSVDAPSVDTDYESSYQKDINEEKSASKDDVNDSPCDKESQQAASGPTPQDDIKNSYADESGPTPEKPFDETGNSSFHEHIVNAFTSEFQSPSEKSVSLSDSRDDTEQKKHRENASKKERKSSGEAMNVAICSKPDKSGSKLLSTPVPTQSAFCGSLFVMDDTESPFCGNIKFSSSSSDKVPASALFSQAFVVQKTGSEEEKAPPVTDYIRWESTNSPLFVMKKSVPDAIHKPRVEWSPYPPAERTPPERLFPDPLVKGFDRVAFDMSQLDVSANVSLDDGSLSDDPSYNPNDTIVYADETEAQADCCGFDTFCADNMFEGLVSNCGVDPATQRQTKEKSHKIPSPRRKNLLSRLRKGNKTSKDKVAYGNLDDGEKESLKGIKKAHVQLRKQNIYGLSLESASQYAPMSDLIEI